MSYNQYKEKIKIFYNTVFNKKWPYGFGTRHDRLFIFAEIFSLSVIVFFLCCWAYGITSWSKLIAPAFYASDGVLSAAFMKAFGEGAIFPYSLKFVARLNAPFGANWNDWPFEEWAYALGGWLSAVFGLGFSFNIWVIFLHIASAISFWATGILFGFRRPFVWLCAILFAIPSFAFYRSGFHLNLLTYWYIPLLIYIVTYLSRPKFRLPVSRLKLVVFAFILFLSGSLNSYYYILFFLFLALICVGHFARGDIYRGKVTLAALAIIMLGSISINFDTFYFAIQNGSNQEAVVRNLHGLLLYGLMLPELFLPTWHRSDVFMHFAQNHYYQQAALLGEVGSPYLGVIGFTGFIGLLTTGILKIVSSRSNTVSSFFWLTLGTFSFAVAGGINYLLGSLGFVMLRGGNRYSIVLLALSLLFVTKALSAYRIPRKIALLLSLFLLIFGVWDQVPHLRYDAERFKADRVFAETLEKALPQGAMVFQLPVAKFPEIPPIVQMSDYEHFRPYLHTSHLKFSYGTIKGRDEADWQEKVAALEPKEMVKALERYGFSAIYINRLGYADRAAALCQQLEALGLEKIANSDELVAYRLSPATQPELPPVSPMSVNYGKGFYGPESSNKDTWLWAQQKAKMKIKKSYFPPDYPIKPTSEVKVIFGIAGLTPRNVWVETGGNKTLVLSAQQASNQVELKLPEFSGDVALHFYSDLPASLPGNGDTRPLSFRLINVHIEAIKSPTEKAN